MNTIIKQNELQPLSLKRKVGYSFGNLGFGVIFQVVLSYLFLYATGVLKLKGSDIGMIAAVGVIWDGITDPIMGYISDHTCSKRFGRRHLYILIGGGSAAIFNLLLWSISPSMNEVVKILWIMITVLLVKTALTIFSTPYSALGAEMSSDYDERTKIQGLRTVFFLIALFSVLVIFMLVFFKSTPLYPQGQLNPKPYPIMGATVSIIMIIATLITYYSTKAFIPYLKQNVEAVGEKEIPPTFKNRIQIILREYATAFKNKDFVFVVTGYMFINVTTALFSVVGMHVFTYTFRFPSKTIGLLFATQTIMCVISQPLWVWVSKKIDKKQSVILGMKICILCSTAMFVFVMFNQQMMHHIIAFVIMSAFLGLGSGVLFSVPMSMIADTIDEEEVKFGKRSEGVYYGLMTLCYKISQSIVMLIVGFLLDAIRFNPNLKIQTETTTRGLGIIFVVGSLVALILGILVFQRYSLNRNEVHALQHQLSERKALIKQDAS